jgi:hypothetical protein
VDVPHVLASRIDGRQAVVSVSGWEPAAEETLARRLDAHIDVEPLGLEEIFLELHR